LEIVETGIEDIQHNYTRFFVVGKGEAERASRCKTSLVFAVPNTPGSLYGALEEFARRGINLTKIESRPRRNRPWQYVFYVDFDGHWQDKDAGDALVYLLNRAAFVKLLGSYPAAPPMENEKTQAQGELLQI
jgi:prephenate dehydratase